MKSKLCHVKTTNTNWYIMYFLHFWLYLVLKLPCMRGFLAQLCMSVCFKTKIISFKTVNSICLDWGITHTYNKCILDWLAFPFLMM